MVMALIAGARDFACGPGAYIPPVLGLGVGLLDGLGDAARPDADRTNRAPRRILTSLDTPLTISER